MERIYVPIGSMTKIAELVGCCRMSVTHALYGRRKGNNSFARKIREIARKEYNGTTKVNAKQYYDRIVVDYGVVRSLAYHFGANEGTVRKALRGLSCSTLAIKIREAALKTYGGYRVDDMGVIVDVTVHEGNYMIQRYGNGVRIDADKESGLVKLYRGAVLEESVLNPGIEELMRMQERAVKMAKESEG